MNVPPETAVVGNALDEDARFNRVGREGAGSSSMPTEYALARIVAFETVDKSDRPIAAVADLAESL